MRPGFLNTCLASLYFLIASAASPRDKYAPEHLPEVVKSVTQDLTKEPTCDELRAMWRFSKRQSRASESTNEIPTYRDPFAYNVWEDHASIRSVGGGKMRRPLVYGRLVHNGYQRPRIQEAPVPERIRGFEDIARMFGTVHMPKAHGRRKPTSIRLVGGNGLGQMQMNNAQSGSFQHLKELIQSERARELHEQKMSEESAARESALQYQRMMIQDATGLVPYSHARSRLQLNPVVFPEVLASSNDYYTNNYNYMQRSYPDSRVRVGAARRYLIAVPNLHSMYTVNVLGSSPRSLLSLQLSPRTDLSQRKAIKFRDSKTPSVIDQEITSLKADALHQVGLVHSSPIVKRNIFELAPQEYPNRGLELVKRDQEMHPLIVYSQPEYLALPPQEIPWPNTDKSISNEPIDFTVPYSQDDTDLKLTVPDLQYEDIAYDGGSDESFDGKLCFGCARDLMKVMRYFDGAHMSSSYENLDIEDASQQDKQDDIESSKGNENLRFYACNNTSIELNNGGSADWKSDQERDTEFVRGVRDQSSWDQKPCDEFNQESRKENKPENLKEEKEMIKPREYINNFAWYPWSTKIGYSDSKLDGKKKASVVFKTLLYPQLLNSVDKGKEQDDRDDEVKIIKVANNEVKPSRPRVNELKNEHSDAGGNNEGDPAPQREPPFKEQVDDHEDFKFDNEYFLRERSPLVQ